MHTCRDPLEHQTCVSSSTRASVQRHQLTHCPTVVVSIQEAAGPGLVFWHPKGAAMRDVVERYWKEIHLQRGYELVGSPHVAKVQSCRSPAMRHNRAGKQTKKQATTIAFLSCAANCWQKKPLGVKTPLCRTLQLGVEELFFRSFF